MKILLVDDELVSREKLNKLVSSLEYETIVAESGEEALKIWQYQRPRMVITDWVMPGMDGLELCKRIREQEGSQYTYIIMLTSKNDISDVVEAINFGADDYITKPFQKDELSVRIRAGERILGFESRDIVIFSLAKLAESRDPETGNHLERIRHYSKILAQFLAEEDNHNEIDGLFIENIFLTSPLHDIGKVGIPDHILLKQGRLDDKEFTIMKNHSIVGWETLNEAQKRYPKAEYLKMSAQIARFHHEKFDGSGYPNGLKGEDIPLPARIVALADVYDALINKRVYKEAFSDDMAKAIILAGKGSHFDPSIVDAFLSCEDKFNEIWKWFKLG